ncbi:MAG TPA: hypothetical protein VF681_05310 [Abditibacteriaceae bacterium]
MQLLTKAVFPIAIFVVLAQSALSGFEAISMTQEAAPEAKRILASFRPFDRAEAAKCSQHFKAKKLKAAARCKD